MASVYVNLPNITAVLTGAATEVTAQAILTELELKANTNEDQQSLLRIMKDGSAATVTKDSVTASNTIPVPVEVVAASGSPINITAGDLNVQLTHAGANYDSTRIGDGTTLLGITASNEAKTYDASVVAAVSNAGVVDLTNSSTTPLAGGAVFTGAAIEITNYSAISVAAISDVASATNGLSMEFSPDGINWDHIHAYDVAALTGVSYMQASELRYFRIVYTNGASAQTYFRLTTILKRHNVMPSRYTFDQGITGKQFADNVKAVIHGLTTAGGGAYVPVKVKPSGALTVEATVTSSALPTGAATSALQTSNNTLIGAVNETAPGTDTASSGLNGRLQRIAQRLTSILGVLPSAIGQQADTDSLSVVLATDSLVEVVQSPMGASFSQDSTISEASVVTILAPANAKKAKVWAGDNAVNLRFTIDGATTPTATDGFILQPNRAEDFEGVASLKVIAESAASNQTIFVHWST